MTSLTPTTLRTNTLTPTPGCNCHWSDWNDFGGPTTGPEGGEIVPMGSINDNYHSVCSVSKEVECRAKDYPGIPLSQLGQTVKCNMKDGLVCLNKLQGLSQQCYDYEIRVFCCDENCGNITTQSSSIAVTTVSSASVHTSPRPTSTVQSSSTVTNIFTDLSTSSTASPSPTFSVNMPIPSDSKSTTTGTASTKMIATSSISSTSIFLRKTTALTTQSSLTGKSLPTTPTRFPTDTPVPRFSTGITTPLIKTSTVKNSSIITSISPSPTTKTSSATPTMTSLTPTTLRTNTLTPTPGCNCHWSDWNDFGGPTTGPDGGEIVPMGSINDNYHSVCSVSKEHIAKPNNKNIFCNSNNDFSNTYNIENKHTYPYSWM
ncbi:mucin-5B-like [Puntigrus tetrazona]|uniref:mucin-5B-like n=1 Tax=Puntigrus tetrazona TaxID=1606681 RepID=UPI001C890A55|nr:mucin-5B-like [Puntigrus tetrazona]